MASLQRESAAFSRGVSSTHAFGTSRPRRASLQVSNAITREKKGQIVTTLKESMDRSVIVFGLRYKNMSVATMQKLRRDLPEQSKLYVCKNSLMKVAAGQTEKFSVLSSQLAKGENAWVFVNEECIADTLKLYFEFESKLFEEAKKTAAKNVEVKKPTELSYIVMDNKYITPEDLKRCESLPTKKDLIATIARLAKQPATKIATGVKMVPTKLAIALKKVSELDDDKTKTVAEMIKA